jgi:hypothetical protein
MLKLASSGDLVAPLIDATLAWFHVFLAVGWLGAAMFFGMVVGPLLPKLSPHTRGELLLNLLPRMVRYITAFSTLTLLMGAALALGIVGGRLELLSPTNAWGLRITIGVTLSFIAFGIALGVVVPAAKRIVKVIESLQQNPQQPPAKLIDLQKRMRAGAGIVMILLIIVLVFMVAAARL